MAPDESDAEPPVRGEPAHAGGGAGAVRAHPFAAHPHRTLTALSLPVLLSLLAEPLAGVVDTAFVARLGADPLAALGVGTMALSGVFWAFNFLGIGTQTRVAGAFGAGDRRRAAESVALALALAGVLGVVLVAAAWPAVGAISRAMGTSGEMELHANAYLRVRLLGGPAQLGLLAAFGALRGVFDMRTPLRIAIVATVLNVALDPVLIFGAGPVPALGVTGAAAATVASQWVALGLALRAVRRRVGLARPQDWSGAAGLLRIGRDLFLRTGALLLFLVLGTRAATRLGAEAGAAHQAVRQVWILGAFVLDAFAASAQSLVGYFLGAGAVDLARRVAAVACAHGLAAGFALTAAMLLGTDAVAALLVPAEARALFARVWPIAAAVQPLGALAFVTDGIHWGAGDWRFLRNVTVSGTLAGGAVLLALPAARPAELVAVWLVTAAWVAWRAGLGVLRIWPAFGRAPLRPAAAAGAGRAPSAPAPPGR